MSPRDTDRLRPILPPVAAAPAARKSAIPVVFADSPDGFERSPLWLMVPVGATRWIQFRAGSTPLTLIHPSIGADHAIRSPHGYNVGAAWVDQDRLFVSGRQADKLRIIVRHSSAEAEIDVSIKRHVVVPIVAHFVEHGRLRKTRNTPDLLRQMITIANGILLPQANVEIRLVSAAPLTRKQTGKWLGRVVEVEDERGGGEWDVLTKHAVKTVKRLAPHQAPVLNLFLVQSFDIPDQPDKPLTQGEELGFTLNGSCIMEDLFLDGRFAVRAAGIVLAHEVGHHLDLRHTNENSTYLMHTPLPHGTKLPRDHADKINPSR